MVLANGTISTADPARPFADAMSVRGGRVLRVGTYESVKVALRFALPLPPSDTLPCMLCVSCRSSRALALVSLISMGTWCCWGSSTPMSTSSMVDCR
jgi:hypothetical protein